MKDDRPTHLDLFSGIGGFSLAFEAEGFRTIGFAEIDPYASAVLKKHWPDVPNYGRVETVPSIRCCVVTAGPPCQPASNSGQRRGPQDDRWLWPQTLEVLERCRPPFAVFENPDGIRSLERGLVLARLLSQMEGLGYSIQLFSIPACAVGAPHNRERIFIVAHSDTRPFICSDIYEGTELEKIAQKSTARFPAWSGQWEFRRSSIGRLRILPVGENGRDDDGVPGELDRYGCLGNAIVPQVAQVFARAIKQTITMTPQPESAQ